MSTAPCPFCELGQRVTNSNRYAAAFLDGYPVSNGHTLVVPRRHVSDLFDMTKLERDAVFDLLAEVHELTKKDDPTIDGFNVGVNCGEAAGQTVAHAHVHLIPRRWGDVGQPRGGVRGVVPTKKDY